MRLKVKDKIFFTVLLISIVVAYYIFSITCPIYSITGMPCLGCGMTRAWKSVLKLEFVEAFKYHSMFWSVPVVYMMIVFDIDKHLPKKFVKFIYIFILVGFFVNWFFKII